MGDANITLRAQCAPFRDERTIPLYLACVSDFIRRMESQPVIVEFDFPFTGPFGTELEHAVKGLAESIRTEPGFVWKIWLENTAEKTAGGIYLFKDRATADAYIEKHTARLGSFGVKDIRCRVFSVNAGLSRVTSGPLG